MNYTLKEIAVSLAQKQQHFVNSLTEESPILDNMRFEPSTHGLWNAYEEVSQINGAGFVDINQPLPEMAVNSDLKKVDLSILGGEILLPEDKGAIIGVSEYFGKKMNVLLKQAGQVAEKKIIYDNFLPYAVQNGKAVSAGASANCYSMVAVRFVEGEVTGLYSAKNINNAGLLDVKQINGGALYKNASGVLGYGVRLKGYIGVQLANPDAVSAIVNITSDHVPTAAQIDNMLVDAKATPASTFIFCHPKVLSMLNSYKGNILQTTAGDWNVNRSFMAWNGIRFVTSYNFDNGTETAITIA
ncbi:MAG: hypothetical protein J6W96_02485 [Alphaproteobacteria bacterium]|nr:hypothetical protein [Alphaproteobacteria bacterium]